MSITNAASPASLPSSPMHLVLDAGTTADRINGQLWTGGAITTAQDVQKLEAAGVTADIDNRRTHDDLSLIRQYSHLANTPIALKTHPSIQYFWNGTKDDGAAKPVTWFSNAWTFAKPVLENGGVIYSHCAAGHNRGPSIAYFLLRAYWGMSPQDAQQLIQSRRPEASLAYAKDADAAIQELGLSGTNHETAELTSADADDPTLTAAILKETWKHPGFFPSELCWFSEAYDPAQPRDSDGRWGSGQGSSTNASNSNKSDADNGAWKTYVHETPDSTVMPIAALKPISQDTEEHIAKAGAFMDKTAAGQMDTRKPLSGVRNSDGSVTIVDGKSTMEQLIRRGVTHVPVTIKESSKLLVSATSLFYPSEVRWFREAYNPDQPRDANGRWGSGSGSGSVSTSAEAFAQASQHNNEFGSILKAAAAATPNGESIHAPIKSIDSATAKVEGRLGGDWSKVHDLVRGTVAVDKTSDLHPAMAAIKDEAEKAGWKVTDVDDRYTGKPLDSGYRDISFYLTHPSGFQGEVQINTRPMLDAKQNGGHQLYEQTRALTYKARSEGRDMTADELSQYAQLNSLSNALYSKAYRASGS